MTGRRLALLIATDGYADPGLSRLRTPVRGADQLRDLLADPTVGGYDDVRLLRSRPCAEIQREIEELLTGRAPDDLVLLYLACHGIRNDADRLFFATVDSQLRRPHTTAISDTFVHDLLDECDARAKIVLLDCCYSGLFHRGVRPMAPPPVNVDETLVGRGTFVITASTALEYAYEGDSLTFDDNQAAGARFTSAIVDGLSTGHADLDHDGVITPEELYTYVHQDVTARPGPGQTPTKGGQCEGPAPLAFARGRGGDGRDASAVVPLGAIVASGQRPDVLAVPIGQAERRLGGGPVSVDLSGRTGHMVVVGRMGSGKTTLLRTLVTALALAHPPDTVRLHLLEGAVNRLGVLRDLPHVDSVSVAHDTAAVWNTLNFVDGAIRARRELFGKHDIESVDEFRRLHGAGRLPEGAAGDVVVVIDGWRDFEHEDSDIVDTVSRLANAGLNYGVHFVLAARRWSEIPPELLSLAMTRVELALDDPDDSRIDPQLAATIGTGWGLIRGSRFRVAVPRLDDDATTPEKAVLAAFAADQRRAARKPAVDDPPAPPVDATAVRSADLLGIADPVTFDPDELRRSLPPGSHLTTPIGHDPDGAPVELDIGGRATGPIGLLAGAVGSDRSNLLHALVLGLAARNSPESLNVLLVSTATGADLTALERLPHVSGLVPDASDPATVDRLCAVLAGELTRRRDLLRETGIARASHYQQARDGGADLAPLPLLFVVVDDAVDVAAASRDLALLFNRIGDEGRALGVRLLLSSDRHDVSLLRLLSRNLDYRLALRVSSIDSRALIGAPDAATLSPTDSGAGFLRHGDEALVRFQAPGLQEPYQRGDGVAMLDAVADRLHDGGTPVRRLWLPPLGSGIPLDRLLADHDPAGGLAVPVGVVDDPTHHRQASLVVDLEGPGGNLAIVGDPNTGRSALVETLFLALASTRGPSQMRFFLINFGTVDFSALDRLPQVALYAVRGDSELVRRGIRELIRTVAEREVRLGGGFDDVVLVVNSWPRFRREFEELENDVVTLMAHGPAVGVHVVVTTNRWTELRPTALEHIGRRLETRLNQPTESRLDPRAAAAVPVNAPGRGLTDDGLHFISALPRTDGVAETSGLDDALRVAVDRIRDSWREEPPTPRVRTLPKVVSRGELPPPDGRAIPLGIDGDTLGPAWLDLATVDHLLVYGDRESGKTAALRLVIDGIVAAYAATEAKIMLVDYRRSLLDAVPPAQLAAYVPSPAGLASVVDATLRSLEPRLPGLDVSARQLTDRSWWQGLEAFIVVDDAELLEMSQSGPSPLERLINLLPNSHDIGLHMVVARQATRAGVRFASPLVQPLLATRRTSALILSGDPADGPVVGGVRPMPLPPGRAQFVTPGAPTRLIQLAHPGQ